MEGQCVVITGASAGIGRAAARMFADHGYRVALLARSKDGLDGARREIESAGGVCVTIPVDVADYDQVELAAERVEKELGPIDIWINNAMATIFAPVEEITPQDFERATRVTYLGSVWGTMAALKRMKPRNRGVIVQVGSALAYRSIPLQAPYCGAKSALRGFTDSLRSELIHDGSAVQLTMVQLSAFNTPQFDWGRTSFAHQPQPVPPIFQPELAARAILDAAQRPRRESWVGFPAAKAIVATRLFPGLLDRLLAKDGYAGQLTDELLPADRQDNLYSSVPGHHATHGRFGDRAKSSSVQYWASTHRGWIAATAVLGIACGLSLITARRLGRPGERRTSGTPVAETY